MVHEVYDSLFFSSNSLFPLEGKCHVVAKGCTGQSTEVILHHYPDRQSAAPLSEAMHSEHDLKERSDAQIIVSRFPCGAQPFYTTLGTKGQRPDGCHMPLCAAGGIDIYDGAEGAPPRQRSDTI